jgi:o-succinylbenzoate synthase
MITFYTYRIPYRHPFITADCEYNYREGLVIRYSNKKVDIISEAAPLPGYSSDDIPSIVQSLPGLNSEINRFLDDISSFHYATRFFQNLSCQPSLGFALSCLALDLIKIRNPDELMPGTQIKQNMKLAVNGIVGITQPAETIKHIHHLYQSGYRTIKLKVHPRVENLSGLIKKISKHLPDLVFRIDANQSWQPDKVPALLNSLGGLPVEYFEEPCRYETPDQLFEIIQNSPIPIALDESIESMPHLQQIIRQRQVDYLIIKPTMLGNLFEIFETFSTENAHSIKRVCTTTLESGIGRMAVSKLAAIIGTTDLAHGLSTGNLFKSDLVNYPEIQNGTFMIDENSSWCPMFSICRQDFLTEIEI